MRQVREVNRLSHARTVMSYKSNTPADKHTRHVKDDPQQETVNKINKVYIPSLFVLQTILFFGTPRVLATASYDIKS